MNFRPLSVSALALAGLLQGCASTEPATTAPARDEQVFVTGSNIPKKDRSDVKVVSKDAVANIESNAAVQTNPTGR